MVHDPSRRQRLAQILRWQRWQELDGPRVAGLRNTIAPPLAGTQSAAPESPPPAPLHLRVYHVRRFRHGAWDGHAAIRVVAESAREAAETIHGRPLAESGEPHAMVAIVVEPRGRTRARFFAAP